MFEIVHLCIARKSCNKALLRDLKKWNEHKLQTQALAMCVVRKKELVIANANAMLMLCNVIECKDLSMKILLTRRLLTVTNASSKSSGEVSQNDRWPDMQKVQSPAMQRQSNFCRSTASPPSSSSSFSAAEPFLSFLF